MQPFYYIEQQPIVSSNTTEYYNIIKKPLTEVEVINLLNYIVERTRSYLTITDFKNDPLVGRCIHATDFIIRNFWRIFQETNIYKLYTGDVFSSKIGHYFIVVIIPTVTGDKAYIIDPTYRQFCLLSYCNQNRIYHYEPYVMPGYFVKDLEPILFLLKHGYIELNEHTAKIYGDSFVLASESYLKKELIFETAYTGKQYIKSFMTGYSIKNIN